MSKIIIYDSKNILIADLDRTESKKAKKEIECTLNENPDAVYKEYAAIFSKFKIIHSISLKKQLSKIEKILKFHKERK